MGKNRDMNKKVVKPQLTRRNFLKGAGVIATVGVATAASGCELTNAPSAAPAVPVAPAAAPPPNQLSITLRSPDVPDTPMTPPDPAVLQVLSVHEAQTVDAYTARLLPGTADDPGAHEAGVVTYIDNMLAYHEGFNQATYRQGPFAQVYEGDAPPVAAGAVVHSIGGDFGKPAPTPTPTTAPSGQGAPTPSPTPTPTLTPPPAMGSPVNSLVPLTGTAVISDTLAPALDALADEPSPYQVIWVPAKEIDRYGYQSLLTPREVYRIGVAALDRYTNTTYGKDFIALSPNQQDEVIGAMVDGEVTQFDPNLSAESFFHNLRRHTSEGMFSDPAYGGNRNMVGWKLVGYPGAQRAYEPAEFQREGTARQPQSMQQMRAFSPGQPANADVVLPVSGSDIQP